MSSSNFANINASINNLQNQFNLLTGNTLINYNQLTRIISQQSNIYNSFYNGTGNIITGNINFTGNILKNINGPWTTFGSNIYYNSGNIGIGTLNPQYSLDISGNSNINGILSLNGLQSTFHLFVNYNVNPGLGGSVQNIKVSNRGLYFFCC